MLQYISFQTNIHHWWLLLLRKPKPRSQYPLATDTWRHLDQNPSTGRFWVLEGTLGNTKTRFLEQQCQQFLPNPTVSHFSSCREPFRNRIIAHQKHIMDCQKENLGVSMGHSHFFFGPFGKFLTLSTKIKSKMSSENFFGSPTIWKNCCCIFEWGGLLEPKFLGCWSHHWCLDRQGSETQIHRRAFEWLAGGVWKSCPKVDTYYWTSVGIYLFW